MGIRPGCIVRKPAALHCERPLGSLWLQRKRLPPMNIRLRLNPQAFGTRNVRVAVPCGEKLDIRPAKPPDTTAGERDPANDVVSIRRVPVV